MKILFLTLLDFDSLDQHNIYTDLLREFAKHNHMLYVISPVERRTKRKTELICKNNVNILKLKIGNTQKTNVLEKGLSTVCIEPQFIAGIKKFFKGVKFDLVIYSTPPITFYRAIEYIKKRDNAKTYLLLKDIFPQNAVDIGKMKKTGLGGAVYQIFRNKEKKLYAISDYIGCMSQANVDYLLKHNPEVDSSSVEVCPNCVEVLDMSSDERAREEIRNKYNIPSDKIVFIYGGNLGMMQGIDFMINCLKSQESNEKVYFLIVGDGTEYRKIEKYIEDSRPNNVKLLSRIPKDDYDVMVGACDVGMLFLDHRFTIPNFPSRLLSYLQAQVPVFAVTDPFTDVGKIIVDGGFGWWCESNSVDDFDHTINQIIQEDRHKMGIAGYKYLSENYSTNVVAAILEDHFNESFND